MLRTYLKIAFRNILKNKGYAFINIAGLACGLAFTLLIGGYIWGEWSVNRSLRHADRQFIIQSRWKDPNMGQPITSSGMLARELRMQYPSLVRNHYRWDGISSTVSRGDKHFREGLQVGDSTFLSMYGFPILYGNSSGALQDPFSLVITAEKARLYFGRDNVVGERLTIDNFSGERHDFVITAVLENLPFNSVVNINSANHNHFFLPASAAPYFKRSIDNWNNTVIASYIELQPGVRPSDLEKPMKALLKANADPGIHQNMAPYLVALPDYYLQANNGLVLRMIKTLSVIAVFILLMAVVNFVNLTVSRASTRLKEIGIRKAMGSLRLDLVGQFLFESTLLVLLATAAALGLYALLRHFISAILAKEILPLAAFPPVFALAPLGLALLISLLAGLYPALMLSGLNSADSLKGKLRTVQEGVWLRKSLIVFQFGTAMAVLIGAILVSRQVNLFFSKDLGYQKEYVVYAPLPRDWTAEGVQRMATLRQEFERLPQLERASVAFEVPNGNNQGTMQLYREDGNPGQLLSADILSTDEHWAQTFSIPVVAGTYFTQAFRLADTAQVVINETHARALGWSNPAQAVGQKIYPTYMSNPLTICGVVNDFHFGSMQAAIKPLIILNLNYNPLYRFMAFKFRPGNLNGDLAALQAKWAQLLPLAPFEYTFMDDALAALYRSEIQLKKATQAATGLAIGIVLLGVLGMVSLSIQKREKEIGVRKVLGASVTGIVALFVREFLSIVALGGLMACPLVYVLVRRWLEGYAYRIAITPLPFLAAIVALTGLTVLLISLQAARVALTNPVRSLRNE